MSSVASPPTTWQEDLEVDLKYFQRFFGYRFRFLKAELREENVQEALCQVAVIYASQWARHGKRTEDRFSIFRTVAYRVKRGRSCPRRSKNADTLDRTYRKTGPKRESDRFTIQEALDGTPARPEVPIDTRLDLLSWLAALPAAQREIAEEYLAGATPTEVAKRHGFSHNTACRWRRILAASFDASRE